MVVVWIGVGTAYVEQVMASTVKRVEELAEGMVLSENVVVHGATLLEADTLLTSAHIQSLRKWHIRGVRVRASVGELSDASASVAEGAAEPAELEKEKQRLEALFATAGEDAQMLLLKSCLLRYAEETLGG